MTKLMAYWPRRRGGSSPRSPKLPPLHLALDKANSLERKVCFYMADCKFTLDEMLECVVPENALQALRAAHPYAYDQRGWYRTMVTLPSGGRVKLEYNLTDNACIVPGMNSVSLQPVEQAGDFAAMLERVQEVTKKYQQLRRVINWLNQHATLGACKFYFPSAASLLPTDHPFHTTGTRGYHEPKKPISEIANDIRDAMETLATGLLLPEVPGTTTRLFSVEVERNRERHIWSQELTLLRG